MQTNKMQMDFILILHIRLVLFLAEMNISNKIVNPPFTNVNYWNTKFIM